MPCLKGYCVHEPPLVLERWLLAPGVLLLEAPLQGGGEGERAERRTASARASARLGDS